MLPIMPTNVKYNESIISTFGGLNFKESIAPGELVSSTNISSKYFPALSSRERRTMQKSCGRTINGLGAAGGYMFTSYIPDENRIFFTYDNTDYEYTDYTASTDFTAERKFAALADSVLIIPDNVIFYINSRTFSSICISQVWNEKKCREKFLTESNNSDLFNRYTIYYVASLTHNSIECRKINYNANGTHTFYYSSFDSTLKQGDIINIKMRVYSDNAEYDSVYRQYCKKMENGITLKIKDIESVTHNTPSGSVTETVRLLFDNNTIDTGGYRDVKISDMTLERGMPNLENICAYNNRIWATSGNSIYTSKLGDPSEWNDFSVDDYGTLPYACFTASAQTEGNFTAIAPYNNYIYAFKENAIHKIFGDHPDEYILHTQRAVGVGKDLHRCLCVSADCIIYTSPDGIYTYKGDYPVKVSDKLESVTGALSAAATEDYYYLLCQTDGKRMLYVYDIAKKIWHTEDVPADSMYLTSDNRKVYLATLCEILCISGSDITDEYERKVNWSFTIRIDDKAFAKKGYGKLSLRYSLGKDASFTVKARYDDGSRSAVCGACHDETQTKGYTLFMPIKRCMWFELEFKGMGEFKLKGINLRFYRGSEI